MELWNGSTGAAVGDKRYNTIQYVAHFRSFPRGLECFSALAGLLARLPPSSFPHTCGGIQWLYGWRKSLRLTAAGLLRFRT